MNGAYKVKIKTKLYEYDFIIKRNITVASGNSGTGKTLLYNSLRRAMKEPDLIKVESRVPIIPVIGEIWDYELQRH